MHGPGPPRSVWHWTILSYELIRFPVMNAWGRYYSAGGDTGPRGLTLFGGLRPSEGATKRIETGRYPAIQLRRDVDLPEDPAPILFALAPVFAPRKRKPQSSSGAETFLTQVFYCSSILPMEQPNGLFITAEITLLRRVSFIGPLPRNVTSN